MNECCQTALHHLDRLSNGDVFSPDYLLKCCARTVLGLPADDKDISDDRIAKAYRKKAMKYHPDRNNSSEASTQAFMYLEKAKALLNGQYNILEYMQHILRRAENRTNGASFDGGLRVSRKRAAETPSKNAAKRHQKALRRTEDEDGGFALKAKGTVRSEGGVLAVAKAGEEARTCLPDAMFVLLSTLLVCLKLEAVRAAFETDGDPNHALATAFARAHGVAMVHQPQMTNSPKTLLRARSGIFLVRLRISVGEDDDYHYVVYDADRALVIDNAPHVPVAEIDDGDRQDNKSAIGAFYHYFPNATGIRIASVLQGQR